MDFVYPTLDTETRTMKVRLELPNLNGALRPGMFVSVELGAASADGVVVPDSAVLDSGTRQLVYVESGPGRFTAREVSVALRADGRAVIRSGLYGRRAGGVLRELPARFGVPASDRHAGRGGRSTRSADMIARIIEFSARNRLLVLLATAAAVVAAVYVLREIRLDALPDLSDTQVIIYSKWDRSPDIIEDQVTYPITCALLGRPAGQGGARLLRLRVLVRLRDLRGRHRPLLGAIARDRVPLEDPGAAARGRADRARPRRDRRRLGLPVRARGPVRRLTIPDELRSYQDWTLRYALQAVPGVAEVASIGGFVKQYQITVDPNKLAAYNLPLDQVCRGRSARATTKSAGG